MAITKTDVLLIAPELVDVTDDQWTAFISDAYLQLNANAFGSKLDLAAKYLVAHIATMASTGGGLALGAIKSESVGGVSRTYETAGGGTGTGWERTAYGAEYARLVRQLPRFLVL